MARMSSSWPPARSLARWAPDVAESVPGRRQPANSHARPEIWSDRAGFEARAAAYAAAATQLATVAQTGDRDAFLAQWTATRATCGACHDNYKSSD